MERYLDSGGDQLIYIMDHSNGTFWDDQWQQHGINKILSAPPLNNFVVKLTQKHLPLGSKILEAGCGMGDKVYRLAAVGFDAVGVDFAPNTIDLIKKNWPHLNVHNADVRKLPFDDNSFDGYWSLGVIEHFYSGYEDVLAEMSRVVKTDGYLFLTFPYMNWIRKYKAKRKIYPCMNESHVDLSKFYQFALNEKKVVDTLTAKGFELVYSTNLGGFKNIKDEVKCLNTVFTKLQSSKSLIARVLRKGIDEITSPFVGHVYVGVFKKSGFRVLDSL